MFMFVILHMQMISEHDIMECTFDINNNLFIFVNSEKYNVKSQHE